MQGPAKRKVFVVDDHPFVHAQFKVLLGEQRDLEYCGGATTRHDARETLARLRPDAVVVDLLLEEDHGIDLIRELHQAHATLPILAFSSAHEGTYAKRVLRAGARGFVSKTAPLAEILAALRQVLTGGVALKEAIKNEMVLDVAGTRPRTATPLEQLSDREVQVLELLGAGKETREIAATLKLGLKTVETYRARLKEKLGLPNGNALLREAFELHARRGG